MSQSVVLKYLRQLEGARRFEFGLMTLSKKEDDQPKDHAEWQVRPMEGILQYDGNDGERAARELRVLLAIPLDQLYRRSVDKVLDRLDSIRSASSAFQNALVSDACKGIQHLQEIQTPPFRESVDGRGVELDPAWCYRAATREEAEQVAGELNYAMSPFVSEYLRRVCHCLAVELREGMEEGEECPLQ